MIHDLLEDMKRLASGSQDPARCEDTLWGSISADMYHAVHERMRRVEEKCDFGIITYCILSDLLINIRQHGTITKGLVDFTIFEAVDYLNTRYGEHAQKYKHLLIALVDPEKTWE